MGNNDKPLVSVLMPVYNGEKFLAETIENILAQSYSNIELIVMDDGSTDASYDIASRYTTDKRVKVFKQPNAGAGTARNRAFDESTGEYIMYMDADDLIASDKIERQVKLLINNDINTVVSSEWDIFYYDISEAKFPRLSIYKDYEHPITLITDMLNGGEMMQTSCWMMTRELIKNTGGWDKNITINDDGVFFTKVLTLASKIVFCPNAHVYYRRGHESLSTSDIYSEPKLQALLYSYMAQAEILLSVDSSLVIKTGIARNMALVMCKAKYGSPLYQKAITKIKHLGLKPRHPFPGSKAATICKLIGFQNFLKIQSLWRKK